MLFQSSIRKELARSFGATLVILITIVMTIVLIRSLGQASRGYINPRDVLLYMAYSGLGRLPTILTLSLFVAMVGTLSRMYRESEMVVWFTSGQSMMELLRPLFRFAWPVLLIIGLLALFVWPWTNQQTQDMRARFESRSDLDRIAPGQFQESSSGNRVFFIDRDTSAEGKVSNNVFIATNEKDKSSITTARSGRIEARGPDQILILENGQRVESATGKPSVKISEFEEYGVRTGESAAPASDFTAAKLIPTQDLLMERSRANMSELAWRLGLIFSAINCVVLAVALSSVNPRGGRGGSLIFVLLTFLVYNNLLNLGQSWVFVGLISFGNFLLALHGGVLALALGWLIKRNANWTFRVGSRSPRTSMKASA